MSDVIRKGTRTKYCRFIHIIPDTGNTGEDFEAINRKFIELRYKLMPYIYSTFWEHHKYGFPILRPVVMIEQDKIENRTREEEFTFGDKILISPILHPGQTSKTVYLPEGKWYNYWTHEAYEGGQEHIAHAAIDSMPIFVKAGSVIPEWPLMQYVGEVDLEEIKFQVYHSAYEVNSFYYEDHGDTFAYEQEIYTEKKFVVKGDDHSLNIRQFSEGLYTPRYETYDLKLIGLPFLPTRIIVDGKEQRIEVEFDSLKRVRIKANKNFKEIQVLS